jgi:GTP pyrophosphokinase
MKKIIVFGRYKHLWSIYRKMCNKDLIFEEIHDIIAFRILVNSVQQCYEALGYIHLLWKPIPGRFKDYIALPKVNGYRSLHTTLFTYNRYGIEIQIRSKEMDEIAESGIAAHWKYKENGINTKIKNISFRGFLWLHRLMNWQKTLKDPNEFLDSIKVDLFIEGTYVFTPNSDVIELPQGSTPVDFAFAIHSDLGIKCFQAKVNNYMVSLKYILKNGDTCLIITRSEQFPSKNWLKFVKTSRAKIKIRSFLRAEDRKQSKEIGKRLLIKELSRYSIEFKKFIKSDNMSKILHTYKYKTIDYLFISLGYGKIDISTLLQSLLPLKLKRKYNLAIQNSKSLKIVKCFSKDSKSVIKLDGVENMLVDYASCCVPIKGDSIIGYIYRDKKMIIHRRNCIKVMQIARERRINVLWDFDTIFISTVFIRVYTNDREGMLKDLSSVFSRLSINIVEAKCKVLTNVRTVSVFKCKIHDLDQLINLIKKLLLVNGVYSANRITLVEFFNNS